MQGFVGMNALHPSISSSGVKERAFPLPGSAVLRPRLSHTEINFMAGSCSAATAIAQLCWMCGNEGVVLCHLDH